MGTTTAPADNRHVIAIDIGGTKLAAARVGLDGMIAGRAEVSTPTDDATAMWDAIVGLVADVAGDPAGRLAVGVGCGGPMERGGETVSPLNIAAWRRFPLRARLAADAGVPTFVDNDAKALALGEGWLGAAAGVADYLAMVVSTGVGGGLVSGGVVVDGASGNAGHIGHIIVEPGGRRCGCGALGCLEAEASGTAIAAITGAPAPAASEAVRVRTGTLVGRAVGSVANLMDLRLAVVAGSVALGYGDVFLAAAQAELDRVCRLEFSSGAKIVAAGCGADGPLIGAAAVALRGLGLPVTHR